MKKALTRKRKTLPAENNIISIKMWTWFNWSSLSTQQQHRHSTLPNDAAKSTTNGGDNDEDFLVIDEEENKQTAPSTDTRVLPASCAPLYSAIPNAVITVPIAHWIKHCTYNPEVMSLPGTHVVIPSLALLKDLVRIPQEPHDRAPSITPTLNTQLDAEEFLYPALYRYAHQRICVQLYGNGSKFGIDCDDEDLDAGGSTTTTTTRSPTNESTDDEVVAIRYTKQWSRTLCPSPLNMDFARRHMAIAEQSFETRTQFNVLCLWCHNTGVCSVESDPFKLVAKNAPVLCNQ
jgi:hypothetical protein